MRWIRNIGLALMLMLAVDACFSPPDYPITPQIVFVNEELDFVSGTGSDGTDILKIVLRFTDGDGDVGIINENSTEMKEQSQFFYSLSSTGQVSLSTIEQSNINYRFKRLNPNFKMPGSENKLPDFVPPFNCTSWELEKDNQGKVIDTVYTELNPNYYNIFVDYYIKNNDGTFTKFDIDKNFFFPNCGDRSLNGARIPNLSKDLEKSSPLDGIIRYNIKSAGIELLFSINILKLKITIMDRAFNRSNEVESKEFTLRSI
jgi:hypothetical protein